MGRPLLKSAITLSAIALVGICAIGQLAGCAAQEPWERTWSTDWRTLRDEPPYLWCGMETPEMTRRIVGAFPLGSSRAEMEAAIERLGLSNHVVDPVDAIRYPLHVTAGGIVHPAPPPGDNDLVLHIPNWDEWEPGVIKCFAPCPYYLWLRFEGDALKAVELCQHHVPSRDAPSASIAHWQEAARKGVIVFTYGVVD